MNYDLFDTVIDLIEVTGGGQVKVKYHHHGRMLIPFNGIFAGGNLTNVEIDQFGSFIVGRRRSKHNPSLWTRYTSS